MVVFHKSEESPTAPPASSPPSSESVSSGPPTLSALASSIPTSSAVLSPTAPPPSSTTSTLATITTPLSPTTALSEPSSPPPEAEESGEGVLTELLHHLEDYTPTVPDALSTRYLNQAGFETVDPRIVRIVSVAAQKFISDIANDALQHCKSRTSNTQHSGSNKDKKLSKDRKYTLTMEDLSPALADHGITMRKPQYFV